MFLIIIICALSIEFISGQELSRDLKCRKCDTKECLDEEKYLSSFMNLSVDPCDNFYEFACGNFMKNGIIDLTKKVNDILTRNEDDIFQDILLQLQEGVQSDDTASTAKIRKFYQNCMSKTYSKKAETEILKDLLKPLGGWPIVVGPEWNENAFSLEDSLKQIVDKRYISSFPFELSSYEDIRARDMLCIGRRSTYFDYKDLKIDIRDSFSKSYYDYIWDAGKLLGARNPPQNITYFKDEILDIMEFEKNVVTKFNVTRCTIDSSIMTIKSLSNELPSTPWLSLFNIILNPTKITVDENDLVAIENWDHISNLSEMLKTTSRRKIANYLGWNIIKSSVKSTQGYLAKVHRSFVNSFFNNRTVPPSKTEMCARSVFENFEFGVGAMYTKRHVDEAWIDDINRIFTNVWIQIKKEVEKLDWMDREVKDVMQEKLDAIRFDLKSTIDGWNNQNVDEYYSELEVYPGTYYNSQLNATLFNLIRQFKHWKNPYAPESYSIFDISAEYQPPIVNRTEFNKIVISPAYVSRSKYNRNRPNYLNYAGVGVTLGHEIAHAFDDINRRFNKSGEPHNLTDEATEMEIGMRFKCVKKQYSNYPIGQGQLFINGRNTFPEDFADHAAYKAAYLAYETLRNQNNNELCLKIPEFENFTWQQMFWINVAVNKCSKYKPGYLAKIIQEDHHSPYEARVNVPLRNLKEFEQAFNCKVNSNMNPKDKCKVI